MRALVVSGSEHGRVQAAWHEAHRAMPDRVAGSIGQTEIAHDRTISTLFIYPAFVGDDRLDDFVEWMNRTQRAVDGRSHLSWVEVSYGEDGEPDALVRSDLTALANPLTGGTH